MTPPPVEVVWVECFEHALDAIACERPLKGWSRAKKEALIRGDWPLIQALARGAMPRPSSCITIMRAGRRRFDQRGGAERHGAPPLEVTSAPSQSLPLSGLLPEPVEG